MRIFLSYAREDQRRVKPIYDLLKNAGFMPWMDVHNLVGGMEWEAQIEREIKHCDMFLIFLSLHSVYKRGIIQKEIRTALRKAEEYLPGDIFIVPVLLEPCEVPDALGKYHWIETNQSGWETALTEAVLEAQRQRRRAGKLQPAAGLFGAISADNALDQAKSIGAHFDVRSVIQDIGPWAIFGGLAAFALSSFLLSLLAGFAALLFVTSGTLLFYERFRRSYLLVVIAAIIAAVSASMLISEILRSANIVSNLGKSEQEIVATASQSCNAELGLKCMQEGGVFGASEALARVKNCRAAEILRSDHPSLQWKDVWTTSVYSYAPGGGGPGGGLDDDVLKVGGWGDSYFSLIQFDLPPLQRRPQFAAILLYSKESEGASVPLMLDRIIRRWDFPKGDRLWWKDRPGHRAITTEALPAPRKEYWYIIELTGLVHEWIDRKSENYGIQLRPTHEFGSFVFFVSSDAEDKSKIPRLIFCA